ENTVFGDTVLIPVPVSAPGDAASSRRRRARAEGLDQETIPIGKGNVNAEAVERKSLRPTCWQHLANNVRAASQVREAVIPKQIADCAWLAAIEPLVVVQIEIHRATGQVGLCSKLMLT